MKVTIDLDKTPSEFRKHLAEITKDPDILKVLSEDEYADVRVAVVNNKKVTQEILSERSKDHSVCVLIAVAKNKRTGTSDLKQLAKHPLVDIHSYAIDQLCERGELEDQ